MTKRNKLNIADTILSLVFYIGLGVVAGATNGWLYIFAVLHFAIVMIRSQMTTETIKSMFQGKWE